MCTAHYSFDLEDKMKIFRILKGHIAKLTWQLNVFQRYHRTIRLLVEYENNPTRKFFARLSLVLLSILCVRFALFGLALKINLARYLQWDLILAAFNRYHQHDGICFLLAALMFQASVWFRHYLFRPGICWMAHAYDLVVRNRERFFELNSGILKPFNWKRFVKSPVKEFQNWRIQMIRMWCKEKVKFYHKKLVHFPRI